jgi:hypothetical protein
MSFTIGFVFFLFGFFCYFFASKIWIEAKNYFSLVSDDIKRKSKFQTYSFLIACAGFILSTIGFILIDAEYVFDEETVSFQQIIGTIMFLFSQTLFIWFNILFAEKYFRKDSIIGNWYNHNFEIFFNDYNILYQDQGNGELKSLSLGESKIYRFWYSVDYNKMRIKITWKENYNAKQKDLPAIVYFGNSEYKYKMKNKLLFIDDSVGYMKRKN